MKIELESVQKPVRGLRKSLKSLPRDPPAEEVHDLRIRTRRVEAVAAALRLGRKKRTRRLLKAIQPVRKAAGEVRDMDVLVGNATTLAGRHRDEAVLRLLEHLGELRVKSARELEETIAGQRKDACRGLKDLSRQIGKRFSHKHGGVIAGPPDAQEGDAAEPLMQELRQWPKLSEENLHPFRIKIKELRYVLQLAEDANSKFVSALGKVKDQIGDWHDWVELRKIAEEVLDEQDSHGALETIEAICANKLRRCLATANRLRAHYLNHEASLDKNTLTFSSNGR
jgi:CHAD domain-containing protein